MFDQDDVAGFQFVQRDGMYFARLPAVGGNGEVGFIVSFERQVMIGSLLEPLSDQQEKNQPRQAIQITGAGMGEDFEHAAPKKGEDAD